MSGIQEEKEQAKEQKNTSHSKEKNQLNNMCPEDYRILFKDI